jgi:hypothetical protein
MHPKTLVRLLLVTVAVTAVVGAGLAACSSLACGDGTHEDNGSCVSNAPQPCGPGTVSSNGECIPLAGSPCGPNTSWEGDAGLCIGSATAPKDLIGSRWTNFKLVDPTSIADLANIQLPGFFASRTIVILTYAESHSAQQIVLHAGSGKVLLDDPLSFSYQETFVTESPVLANLGTPGSDGTPFTTDPTIDLQWNFYILGTGATPLYLYKVKVGGNLDADNLTKSPNMSGYLEGCFLADSGDMNKPGAKQVWVDAMATTLQALIVQFGGNVDSDCTGSGTINGYKLSAHWQADEKTILMPGTVNTPDGGAPSDGGTPSDGPTD